jgi:serine/threonine protein kinase
MEYAAPKRLGGQPYTKAFDWWTYGIAVYEMLCGLPPFWDDNSNRMYQMIINAPLPIPEHVSATARDLTGKLLQKEPSRRLGGGAGGWNEIKSHPFFDRTDWDGFLRKDVEAEWRPRPDGEGLLNDWNEGFTLVA